MICSVKTLGISGIQGSLVTAECFISNGLPGFDIVGLPDAAVKEARERVRAAAKSSGLSFPVSRITVNLAPASRKKTGTHYDLPILLSILSACGSVRRPRSDSAFLGEVSLDGKIRSVTGVLPMALADEPTVLTIGSIITKRDLDKNVLIQRIVEKLNAKIEFTYYDTDQYSVMLTDGTLPAEDAARVQSADLTRDGALAGFVPNPAMNQVIFRAAPQTWIDQAFSVYEQEDSSKCGALLCRVTAVEQPKSDGWAGMENLLTELVQRKRVEGMYQTFMRMLEQKAKIEVYNSRVLESAGI